MNRLELDEVTSRLNDNHTFADLVQGVVVESRIKGFDIPYLYLHMVQPYRFGETNGNNLLTHLPILDENRERGHVGRYPAINSDSQTFKRIARRIAMTDRYVDITGLGPEMVSRLAKKALEIRISNHTLFADRSLNDALGVGHGDSLHVGLAAAMFRAEEVFYDFDRNVVAMFETDSDRGGRRLYVGHLEPDLLQQSLWDCEHVESGIAGAVTRGESLPFVDVNGSPRTMNHIAHHLEHSGHFQSLLGVTVVDFAETLSRIGGTAEIDGRADAASSLLKAIGRSPRQSMAREHEHVNEHRNRFVCEAR